MASKSKRNRQRRKNKEALLAAPDVAITVSVATPDKQKKMGGGIMSPPEREMYAAGSIVQLLKKILKLSPCPLGSNSVKIFLSL